MSAPLRSRPLVFVGTATHDTIVLVDRYPGADERVVVDELVSAGGGPAATAAVTAARLGRHAAFVGAVGDDEVGDAIVAGLEREGVDTSGVLRRPGGRSATSVVVVAREGATRSILHRPADAVELSSTGWELIARAEWVHVDQIGWPLVDAWRRARSGSPRLSVDAGNPVDGVTVDGVDLYVPTLASLRRRHGDLPTERLLATTVAEGARLVVATDGSDGAWVRADDGPTAHVPAFATEIRSTLGAGDVFHGALLAAIDRGLDVRDAATYASAVAALSCRGLDGRSAIPDHERTLTFLEEST
ncbi:MAG: carbohydrate kinase family protein [Acidimicrobiia bacterium]